MACTPHHSITVTGEKGVSAGAELVIQELVIRNALAEKPASGPIFVSFGESWEDRIDPPDGFLERLSDMDIEFKPVSQYRERADANPLLLIVRVTKWTSDTEAEVEATRFRLGVGGADSFTTTVEWTGGAWKMGKTVGFWSA